MSLDESCDARCVYAVDHNREAQCAGPVVALLFSGKAQETGSVWTRPYRVYLFCVFVCLRQNGTFLIHCLILNGGGDGLEPAVSAVTANRGKVSQQLAGSQGCQRPRKSCKPSHSVGRVVGWKTFKDCPRLRLIVVPILNYRLLFAHNDSGAKWLRRSSAVIMLNGTRRRAEFAA